MVAANTVPPVEVTPRTLEKLDEMQGVQCDGMSVEHRKEMLASHNLLTKYHNIFSLESRELGCTNLAKHDIQVVDDEPFRRDFKGFPLPCE